MNSHSIFTVVEFKNWIIKEWKKKTNNHPYIENNNLNGFVYFYLKINEQNNGFDGDMNAWLIWLWFFRLIKADTKYIYKFGN